MRKSIPVSAQCLEELDTAARGLRHAGAIFHAIAQYVMTGDVDKCDLLSLVETGCELSSTYAERVDVFSEEARHDESAG